MCQRIAISATEADLKVLIGGRLAAALRDQNRSAKDLAAHLGKTGRAVRCWLNGTNMMPTAAVVQAAGWLGVEPDSLLPSLFSPPGAPPGS